MKTIKKMPPPSRDSILQELYEISEEIKISNSELIRREGFIEADKVLDWYIDLGYLGMSRMVEAPAMGYEQIESD